MYKVIVHESFDGTLETDDYAAYARFAKKNDAVTHARSWTHTRRKFIEAQSSDNEWIWFPMIRSTKR